MLPVLAVPGDEEADGGEAVEDQLDGGAIGVVERGRHGSKPSAIQKHIPLTS